ncbi:hypothetical protein [Bosea beijingensis]|jgi:hypothetical protein|uniref:hypothetical protein n=1 Tax=Bosea beijingensis TaxID=3068632 RepID=UPI0027419D6A|nr:hypothetical protein [Bosea sp. REN20]
MKTTSALSLADIELELPLRPVIDDLAGLAGRLSLAAGPEKGYAALAAEPVSVCEIAARAIGYADEIGRFLELAGTSDRMQVAAFLDMLIGLSLLNAASTLAVALLPPRTPADIAIRQRVLNDIITAGGGDVGLAEAARQAFAHDGTILPDAIATELAAPAVPATGEGLDQRPAMLGLEQGLSLAAFVRSLAPSRSLIARAALQLDDADRFAAAIAQGDLDMEALDRLRRADAGATLLATADLARACLIAALAPDDQTVRPLVAEQMARLSEPRLRDIVMLAGLMAERLKELRRMQRETAGGIRVI